jgi:hypothetical protein
MHTQIIINTIWKSHLNLGNKFPNPTLKILLLITHFQFTYCTLRASRPGLGYTVLIYVGHSYGSYS